jgi:hypothetical protein
MPALASGSRLNYRDSGCYFGEMKGMKSFTTSETLERRPYRPAIMGQNMQGGWRMSGAVGPRKRSAGRDA